MICSNQINNCPVKVQDSEVAQKVQSKNIASLQGNNTKKRNIVARYQVNIPVGLINLHKEVFLTCNIFFVNKIPFFLTLSRKIYFTAANHLANRTVPKQFKAFKELYQYSLHIGFHITTMHADGEFGPLKILLESLPGVPLVNLAAENEHIPDIERQIRAVKERCRATCHNLPFHQTPKLLTTCIFLNTMKMINLFPTKEGIPDNVIRKTIMSGETLDFKNHLRLQLGQ